MARPLAQGVAVGGILVQVQGVRMVFQPGVQRCAVFSITTNLRRVLSSSRATFGAHPPDAARMM